MKFLNGSRAEKCASKPKPFGERLCQDNKCAHKNIANLNENRLNNWLTIAIGSEKAA